MFNTIATGGLLLADHQEDVYPLTPSQKRMWIIHRMNRSSTAYNSPVVRMIKGAVDVPKLKDAFSRLLTRHEQLRAAFVLEENEPVQYIQDIVPIDFTYRQGIMEDELNLMITDFIQPFQLERSPLIRACLLETTATNTYVLVIDMHHIISDLLSEEIIVRDLFQLYHDASLPVMPLQYKEHALWLSRHAQPARLKEAEDFWSSKLNGGLSALTLPADFKRPAVFDFNGTIRHYPISTTTARQLRLLSAQSGASLHRIGLTALFVLLHKFSYQDDIIVGAPRELRPAGEMDNLVGLFINTLPVRAFLSPDKTFRELLHEVDAYMTGAEQHFAYDVGYLVEKYAPHRDSARNPLYNVLFFHQQQRTGTYGGLEVSPVEFIHSKAELDLTFGIMERDEHLGFSIEYYTRLFKDETITALATGFGQLLETLATAHDTRIEDMSVLTKEQEQQQLQAFIGNASAYPKKTLHGITEELAASNPQHPALVFHGQVLTRRELDERSNRLAQRIRACHIKTGAVVALLTAPSAEMIIAILGILKAGCTYLPLDPALPEERLLYMLQDSRCSLLLAQPSSQTWAALAGITVIPLNTAIPEEDNDESITAATDPSLPAYIIYTSGSTGIPKGVKIRHFNVVCTLCDTNYLRIQPSDRLLQLSNYVFDASVFEIFGALLNGATLVLADQETRRDIDRVGKLITEQGVTVAFMITAVFNAIVDNIPHVLQPLRKLMIGGEELSVKHTRMALAYLGPDRLINVYGPTETTVFASYYPIDTIQDDAERIPIGYPLSNTQLYILSGSSLVPAGVPGELCIAGDGLAEGYLDEEMTSRKFISIPQLPGVRLYRSGDIVRQLPDGAIDFIGRKDQQTKIRGFRIELGEINAQLHHYPGIKDAVTIVHASTAQDKYIHTFYTVKPGAIVTAALLNDYLATRLPAYMLPSAYTVLDALPLTANGKVDQQKLAEQPGIMGGGNYTAPTTDTERTVETIWKDLLKKEKISIHQHFFECGGHSLKATIMAIRLQQVFRVELTLSQVFEHPTIAALAAQIDAGKRLTPDHNLKIAPAPKQTYSQLSFSETMVYVHQHSTDGNHSYCSLFPMLITGNPDTAKLERALNEVVKRHRIFRTGYMMHKGIPAGKVFARTNVQLIYREGDEEEIVDVVKILKAPYPLEKPPLLRAALVKLGTDRYFFALANHHIISDGVTETMLVHEISRLYEGHKLAPVALQYQDYVHWQQQRWVSGYYRVQEQFWLRHLEGALPVLELPYDFARPPKATFGGHTVSITTDAHLTQRLQELAATGQTSLFIVLLTAYAVLLHKYTDQEDIIIGVPMANRMHADLQDVMGMFVNMAPWRCRPAPDRHFMTYLHEMKITATDIYQHQDYPFEKLAGTLLQKKDPSRNPLFDTLFALHSTGLPLLDIAGLHCEAYPITDDATKVDLTVEVLEHNGQLQISFKYNTSLFKESTIQRMTGHYLQLLGSIIQEPQQRLRDIEILTSAERDQLLYQFNPPATPYPKEAHLYQLFEQQVRLHPEKTAIRFESTALTYRALQLYAEHYAAHLLRMGAGPDTKVAIIADRSPEMIISIWAILRAGATYVPIDPDYPAERIAFMLEDSAAAVCLTTYNIYAYMKIPFDGKVIIVDGSVPITGEELPSVAVPAGPAYIMYTSGSTGEPKGIAVMHHNVIRTVRNTNYIGITAGDHILQLSNYVFDGSVFDIFGALLNGATLVLLKKDSMIDIEQLGTLIERERITILFITTALFNACIQMYPECFAPLRKLLFGGEQASPAHVQMALEYLGSDKLIHVYGPTENTVFSTTYAVNEITDVNNIPIGSPLSNTQAYVFNSSNTLNPLGVPGELYLAGDGLAQGYWNRSELSKERFLDNPFLPGTKLYKTGDLVRWQDDGQLIFVGRKDQQVKIRGFRIEPGEIEVQLGLHPDIDQCAVVVKENSLTKEKQLYACYTSGKEPGADALKEYLGKVLPLYMIPDWLIHLPALPLNANGKIDRKALISQATTNGHTADNGKVYTPPASPAEEAVAAVWCQVFGVETVGVLDNFYSLGGHSLKALQVASLLQQEGFIVSVNDLFTYLTVRDLAANIRRQKATVKKKRSGKRATGNVVSFPLSAVQQRFFQRPLVNRNIFNSPFLISLTHHIDPALIQAALQRILEDHPVLTVYFRQEPAGQWTQHYQARHVSDYFVQVDLSSDPVTAHAATITRYCETLQQQFWLTEGPLLRVVLFEHYQQPGRQALFFLFHHLLFDGISWQVLMEELQHHCQYPATDLPFKTSMPYEEWCRKLQRYALKGGFKTAGGYWKAVVEKAQPFVPDMLPGRNPQQQEMIHHLSEVLTTREEVMRLQQAVTHYEGNVFTLLLAAFFQASRELQERSNLPLYVMTAQREPFLPGADIQRTIGFFAGAYPVCINITKTGGGNTGVIKAVKDMLLAVPKGGLDYFVLKHLVSPSVLHEQLDHVYPVLFHYLNLPSTTTTEHDFYTPLQLPVGLTHDPRNPSAYLINITAVQNREGLKVTFYYSQAHFYEGTVTALAAAFRRHLLRIINVDEQ
ncbi:MAG TPA: amino acid adenylation domain-containing protein [Chitinophaga sp.]|uniref:non-ribosomal peptide synthetase n=1 Tax=Chitinophaga sp. TaxID=1869181 RepID=UPI002C3423B6|nr:non-ribosomal peptide synthetase [Chitinophaga sp.]HVI43406.1 amino acid adenylation domain-containing protein [Chitinophaga sp.]